MDTFGCPLGYATDRLFLIESPFPECGESIIAYWTTFSVIGFLRVLLTIVQIRIALYHFYSKKESKGVTRIPITTVSETIYTVLSIISFILIGLNITNAQNGYGPAVTFIASLPFNIAYVLSCLKLVNLGDRVIPKSIRNQLKVGQANGGFSEADNLSSIRRDPILIFLFASTITAQFLGIVFPVIIGAFISPGEDDINMVLGMAFLGATNAFATSIIIRQTFRVVNYIKSVQKKQESVFSENEETKRHGDGEKKIEDIVRRLKLRAVLISAGESIAIIVYFLVFVIPFSWKILAILYCASTIGALGSTLVYKPPAMKIFGTFYSSTKTGSVSQPSGKSSRAIMAPSGRFDSTSNKIVDSQTT